MSPTASLRRLAGRATDWARSNLARFLAYSLDAISDGHVSDAVLVKTREAKGKRIKRTWVHNGRKVERRDGFVVVVDAWGNSHMFAADTVVSAVHRDLPRRAEPGKVYRGKVKF